MKGTEIAEKIGMNQTHCAVEKEIFEINPDEDYVIVRGTDRSPRVVCKDHEKAVRLGRYVRMKIVDNELVSDPEWVTGHNAFENDVEPRFTPKRPKTYMIQ